MRTIFTFLNHLRGSLGNLQSSDVSLDRRLTVGSPSGLDAKWKQNPFMRFAIVLTFILSIGVGNVWGATVTYTTSDFSGGGESGKNGEFSVTQHSPISVNAVGYKGSDHIRFYSGGEMTISGATITQVVFTCKSNAYATALAGFTFSSGSCTASSTTATWKGSTTSLTITSNAQTRYTQFVVTYTASCTKIGAPTVTATPGNGRIDLSWSNQTGASSYMVTKTPSGGSVGTPSKSGSTWSCAITGLTNGTTYTWSVEAVGSGDYCASGNTAASASATPNVFRTITYYDKDGQHTTSLADGTNIATALTALYGGDDPVSCDATNYEYFVGWKVGEISGTASSVTLLDDEVVNASSPSNNYYAVWSDTDPSAGGWEAATSIAAGDVVVLCDQDCTYELNGISTTSTTYGILASVEDETPAKLYPLTIEAGASDGTFSFKNGTTYLSWSSGNSLASSTTKNNNSSWTVSISEGVATIRNKSDNTRYLQYNSSGSRFACYTNTQKDVALYKQTSSGTPVYITTCCTPLGQINGSVNLSSSTDGTVTVSGWTYNDESGSKPAESNVSSYTVKLYKYNSGTSSWALANESSTTGGASGPAATRTGIAVSGEGSKSVTYSGLEYGATYKFTVTANGTGSYCDGDETAVTSINGNALTDNKFLNKYSIYIDEHDNSSYTHHYIESLSSHSGSVDINLEAFKNGTAAGTYYQYKLVLGGVLWFGNNGTMNSTYHDNWTFSSGVSSNCKLQTAMGGAYTFAINTTDGGLYPQVSVNFPSANQAAGYNIYWDNSVLNWGTLRYRIGNNSNNQNQTPTLVPGTDNFYVVTTPLYNDMEAWHFANNPGWADSHTIYRTATDGSQTGIAITASTVFQQYKVTEDITVIPTTTHSTGTDNDGDKVNNQCEFYTINTPTSGMLTHNIAVGSADHGTVVATYTNTSGTAGQTVSEGANADLAHRCIVTITATPDDGYSCTSLTVNGAAFTSGNEHILTADATIAATFTAQTSTVTLDNNDATSGSQQTVSATYDAAMPLTTTSSTPVAALSRTGYTFNGWWDATSGGTQYYSYNAGTSTLSSARTWDKTGVQILKAQWSINSYTLTWAWGGGSTSAASGEDYTAAGSVAYNTALEYPADNTMSRNGYTFTGWSSSATNMPAEALTITAQWEAKQYTVTLDNKSATTSGSTSVTATFDAILPTIIPPTKDGYRFDGYWTEASGGTKYINADGTGATAYKKYSAGEHKLHAHWVPQLTFSVNGAIDDELTRDDNTAMPSTAAVPTACGDCWAFMGWSTNPSESGAPAYAGGATHEFGEPTTLYAVFGKAEYEWISSTSGLVANDYYVLTNIVSSKEYAISNTAPPTFSNDASSTEVTDKIRENAAGYILYNPAANNIWKFTGTKDAGQLQNVGNTSLYLNLSGSGSILSTSNNLTFTLGSNGQWTINSTKYLRHYSANDWDAATSLTSGDFSCYLYHQISAEYATEPSCETYDIVWKVNGTPLASGSQTEETNTCAGIEELPTDPDDDELDCATKFMGWSESTLIGTGQSAPADLFTDAADAPAIDGNKTFHAVFASVDAENTTTVTDNLTCSLTGITGTTYTEWSGKSDNSSAVYAGNSCESSTNKAIQIKSKNSNSGIVTTASGGKAKKITITWSNENTSGKTIDIYGKNSAYSDATDLYSETASTLGTKLGSIAYGTSTEFTITGDYAYIGIRSNDGAAYLSNVAIKWESAAYKDYMTSCCDELVTLSTNSPANGTISFSPASPIATCDANKTVTMTITPSAGYKLSDWAVATGDGKVPASSTVPAVVTGEDNSDAQVITLTFDRHLSGDYAVSATFEQMHDEYYDYMHDNAKVGANRTGAYSAPSRTSKTPTSGEDCKTDHYKFKGWVVSTEINDDGTLKDGYTLITAGSSMTASNKVYYAVWAEEE